MYPEVSLLIDGKWSPAQAGRTLEVLNPATGEPLGTVAHADRADLDRALEAAQKGFEVWRNVSAYDRSKIMRKAADLLRERADGIARMMTLEQGKPLAEAKGETLAARRRHRLVRRGRPPRLWPRHPGARAGHLPARREGAGRARSPPSRRGTSRSTRSCASSPRRSHGLLDHREGPGGDAGLARRADPRLRRCGRAGGRRQPRLRRAVRDFGIPHPASDHPQDLLHGLDADRQASRGARGRST